MHMNSSFLGQCSIASAWLSCSAKPITVDNTAGRNTLHGEWWLRQANNVEASKILTIAEKLEPSDPTAWAARLLAASQHLGLAPERAALLAEFAHELRAPLQDADSAAQRTPKISNLRRVVAALNDLPGPASALPPRLESRTRIANISVAFPKQAMPDTLTRQGGAGSADSASVFGPPQRSRALKAGTRPRPRVEQAPGQASPVLAQRRHAAPEPTTVAANGEVLPNLDYLLSEHDLVRPPGVPDYAPLVVNYHYRHGRTNANAGEPMVAPDGRPVDPSTHLTDLDGRVATGTPWYAGNKLGNWVQLLQVSRAQAQALQGRIRALAPSINFVAHSPVQRAVDTMNLATQNSDLPRPEPMPGLAERGVGIFGYPKTPSFDRLINTPGYRQPVELVRDQFPWSKTPNVTGPETVAEFSQRMKVGADGLARKNFHEGNGLLFHHQYSVAGYQHFQYRMTGGAPRLGMPRYGIFNPPVGDRHHNPNLPVNPDGFMTLMDAGHKIPNGATLARVGWAWVDERGRSHFVPAPKGFSDLAPPAVPDVDEDF
jgi:broad specificity phosphatase PhoE